MDDAITERVECPRCGSAEFAIDVNIYQASSDYWVVCRQCDWTIGEITRLNLAKEINRG